MILKQITSEEFDLKKSFVRGFEKLNKLSKFDKFITYFWILGPLFYLIERDPADLWLTTISILFLFRCLIKNNWHWSGQLWFIFALLLWLTGLLSALLGPYKIYSFWEGFLWIRFPLYAAAAQVWIGRDRDIRILMFISMILGLILICIILSLEILLEGPKPRLMWPYGDAVPGSFIAKICLPVLLTFLAVIVSNFSKNSIIVLCSILIPILLVFLTGERGNFLICFFSMIFAIFSWKLDILKIIKSIVTITIVLIIGFFVIYNFSKNQIDRYGNQFFKSIPIINFSEDNFYWGAWRSGIQQALDKPIIGLGPASSRKHCKKMSKDDFDWLPGRNYCGNHPHNYYIQLFSETGIFGLLFGMMMFFHIFKSCFRERAINNNCPMIATCFIIPIALFFPLQQTGNFYGQWANLFIWFPIGFCLSQITDYKSLLRK